jgi:hypothetical protein
MFGLIIISQLTIKEMKGGHLNQDALAIYNAKNRVIAASDYFFAARSINSLIDFFEAARDYINLIPASSVEDVRATFQHVKNAMRGVYNMGIRLSMNMGIRSHEQELSYLLDELNYNFIERVRPRIGAARRSTKKHRKSRKTSKSRKANKKH